jgi:hypothetical protein
VLRGYNGAYFPLAPKKCEKNKKAKQIFLWWKSSKQKTSENVFFSHFIDCKLFSKGKWRNKRKIQINYFSFI